MAVNVVEYALKIQDSKAKKSLKDTAKAADDTSKSTMRYSKTADVAMRNAANSARRTRSEYMALRRDSANLDRLTGELSSAFALLSPELSSAASTASAVAGGFEGVFRVFTVLNVKLLAIIGTVGAVVATYKLLTSSAEAAREEQRQLNKRLTETEKSFNDLRLQASKAAEALDQVRQANERIGEIGLGIGLENLRLEGMITKEKYLQIKADESLEKAGQQILKQAEKELELQKSLIVTIGQRLEDAKRIERAAKQNGRALSKQRVTEIRQLRESAKVETKKRDLLREQVRQLEQVVKFGASGNQDNNPFVQAFLSTKDALAENVKINVELDRQKEKADRIAKANKRRQQRAKEITKAIQEQFKALSQVEKTINKMIGDNSKLEKSHVNASAKLLQTQAEVLRLQAETETGNKRSVLLVKAMNAEDAARLLTQKQKNSELQKEIDATQQTIKDSLKIIATAKAELEILKTKTKDKKELKKLESELTKTIENQKKLVTVGEQKIQSLEKQGSDNRKQYAAEEAKRQQKATNERVKGEQKRADEFVKANNKIAAATAKGIEMVNAAMAAEMQERQDKIIKRFEAIKGFIDSITDPGQIVTGLTTAIGSAFGALGGQIGGTVGGIIGAIASIGQKDPKTLQEEFNNFLMAFEKGMEILPELLTKLLPSFTLAIAKGVVMSIPLFIRAIIEALENLARRLLDGLSDIFSLGRIASEISQSIAAFFGDLFGFKSGGRVRQARAGMRVTSGSFGASQLAMVHPGEIITPQSGARPQAIDRTLNQMSGAQGVTVVINSAVTEASAIDGLVRKIENRFNTFGSAKSPLFG